MTYWIGADGWPCEFEETSIGVGLARAIRAVPGGGGLDAETVGAQARMLLAVSEGGRDEELPRSRPASQKASERELIKLHDLAKKLADHIESMRRPAINALSREGAYVFDITRSLRELEEYARCAFGGFEIEGTVSGAPRKIEAFEVASIAAGLFENISGRRATYTADKETGEVSGAWPEFLEAVYKALHIRASVAAQVRAVSEKSRQKMPT